MKGRGRYDKGDWLRQGMFSGIDFLEMDSAQAML